MGEHGFKRKWFKLRSGLESTNKRKTERKQEMQQTVLHVHTAQHARAAEVLKGRIAMAEDYMLAQTKPQRQSNQR